jgi:hypothetical protein
MTLDAQPPEKPVNQPFSNYEGPKSTIRYASIEWNGLGDRKVVSTPELMFLLPRDISLEYDLTIAEDGHVLYVKTHPCPPEYVEFRKGGISALYGTRFTSVPAGKGSQKAKAIFIFAEVEENRPAPMPK